MKPTGQQFDLVSIQSQTFVEGIQFQHTMESTNDWALQNCSIDSHSYPLLVLCEKQVAGRGRGQNRWLASGGSLTCSLVLPSDFIKLEQNRQGLISLAAGVAVVQAIERVAGLNCQLKWPNDLMLEDRKLGGILVETKSTRLVVIGIGININHSFADEMPGSVSLCEALGDRLALQDVLISTLDELEKQLQSLNSSWQSIVQAIQSCDWLRGRRIKIGLGTKKFAGIAGGINEAGGLLVRTDDGKEHTLFSGSIELLEDSPAPD